MAMMDKKIDDNKKVMERLERLWIVIELFDCPRNENKWNTDENMRVFL